MSGGHRMTSDGKSWMEQIHRHGRAPFHPNSHGYKVFRNVKHYGVKGDGKADDTEAINRCIADGGRCGEDGGSSTVSPALVFFPIGTYLISSPIIQYYNTQLVGDPKNPPTILASPHFSGIALIDSNPYVPEGHGRQWYIPQDNFFRQIRNFCLSTLLMPPTVYGTGIHWQVAQATSLQNISFHLSDHPDTRHQGIFMENGSGGFMCDLTVNGGKFGLWVGNQQFTVRNVKIRGAQTGVCLHWNWSWTFQDIHISDASRAAFEIRVPVDGKDKSHQAASSCIILDSTFSRTPVGVLLSPSGNSQESGLSLVLDNVDLREVSAAVQNEDGQEVLKSEGVTTKVDSWCSGHVYLQLGKEMVFQQDHLPRIHKPSSLLDKDGRVFTRSKPQYENVGEENFVHARDEGAAGDGLTDDTAALNGALQKAACLGKVFFLDAGVYLVTSTVIVPVGSRIVGECWSNIMATGPFFADESRPRPVVLVGGPEEEGVVELSDLIFSTRGPTPGAVMVRWNASQSHQGSAGMWDCHIRIGGATGTCLREDMTPKGTLPLLDDANLGPFLGLHVKPEGSGYFENVWVWLADHDLDSPSHGQLSVFAARGALIESRHAPTWLWGTGSEHFQLYQYQLNRAKDVWMGLIQTETPYYQARPPASGPFRARADWRDPVFVATSEGGLAPPEAKAWALRVLESEGVLVYGAGLYSFFDDYKQDRLKDASCQQRIVDIDSRSNVAVFGLSTVGVRSMIDVDGQSEVPESDNRAGFPSAIGAYLGSTKTHF